jgi:hypothetical protein
VGKTGLVASDFLLPDEDVEAVLDRCQELLDHRADKAALTIAELASGSRLRVNSCLHLFR